MTNEYGQQLDRNNYAPSVVYAGIDCYWCGTVDGKIDRHEIYHGAYRQKSKELGLWVPLCHSCHMRLHQRAAEMDAALKCSGQLAAQEYYGWSVDEFRRCFGKNYR